MSVLPGPRRLQIQAGLAYAVFILAISLFQILAPIHRAGRARGPAWLHPVRVVDLTAESARLDETLVGGLALKPRKPGTPAAPERHSWQLKSLWARGVEMRWVEASHRYELPGPVSEADLQKTALELERRWKETSGGSASRSIEVQGDRGILSMVFNLRLADRSLPELALGRLTIQEGIALTPRKATPVKPVNEAAHLVSPPTPPKPEPKPALPVERPLPPRGPRIAIVLDDAGEAPPVVAAEFFALQGRFTLAILPYAPYSREQAQRARRLGWEVIAHLPMEPQGGENPGPGAILTGLDDDQIVGRVQEALAAVPEAIGVNNHMGSKATTDPRVMQDVMRVLKARGLFFLDSMTIGGSVGKTIAIQSGVPTARRKVFLDNSATEAETTKQLKELVRLARRDGSAIAIGHLTRPATARALARFLPTLKSMGIQLVPLSQIVH